ncbi:MAG TPA: NAD(P)-dependent oxidoreductase [Nocardioides sp.]|uniref:NAD(P)-dependent oxidoreductase n=1 Tax=Nocardioides sp. TaxID=35761 RepID=UPI002CEDF9E0|nr:NAD(P)-dependent oxidoreductase [Nocardioides sp.]HTW16660.1 NAD(P)-dependent oxidoreductase [Nocardioides sp.]
MLSPSYAVGFVGLGAMGSQLSRHALEAGLEVWVHDLDPARVAALSDQGAHAAAELADLARRCRWIVTSLPTASALHGVVDQVAGAPGPERGGLIETSTLSVEDKERAAATLGAAGLGMVDAPLSGTSQQAATRDLIAYVSGSPEDCAAALPVIRTFTRAQYQLGRLGNGTRMKLVANHLVAIHNVAAAEALLLAARAGLDLPAVIEAVSDGAGGSRMLQVRGPLMASGEYAATMRVDNFVKDIDIIEQHAGSLGSPVPLLAECARLYRTMLESGRGDLDTAAVFDELLRGSEQAREA